MTVPSLIVNSASPIDVRTVVDSISDLTSGSIQKLYTGIVVNIKGTNDLYVLTKHPRLANNIDSWVKVGGSEKNWCKVVDSTDDLYSIDDSFEGMFAYVLDDSSTSEDESGLYINNGLGWIRIMGGSGEGGASFIIESISENEILNIF